MSEQHMSPVPMIRLHDGAEIPQVGLGVLRIDDEGVTPVTVTSTVRPATTTRAAWAVRW